MSLKPKQIVMFGEALPPALDGQGALGFRIDPEEIVTPDNAVTLFGREIGRLGTILKQIDDPEMIGRFVQLYGQCITRYMDALLKQQALQTNQAGGLAAILSSVYDQMNEEMELDL